jgi:hypothetical protein
MKSEWWELIKSDEEWVMRTDQEWWRVSDENWSRVMKSEENWSRVMKSEWGELIKSDEEWVRRTDQERWERTNSTNRIASSASRLASSCCLRRRRTDARRMSNPLIDTSLLRCRFSEKTREIVYVWTWTSAKIHSRIKRKREWMRVSVCVFSGCGSEERSTFWMEC